MKLKVSTSPIYNILLFVAIMDCGIFAAFSLPYIGNTGNTTLISAVISVILFVNCIANKSINNALKPYRNFINFYMILIVAFIAIMVIYSYNKYGQGPRELFNCFRQYLLLFLVTPIIFVIQRFGYSNFIRVLVWFVLFVIILHVITALVYNSTGRLILPAVKFGIRSGRLRCHVPSAFGVAISYITFKIFEEKLQKNKIKWIGIFIFIFIYLLYVCMTRMLLISVSVTLLVMYLLRPRAKTNQVIVWVLLAMITIMLVASGVFSAFLATFSETSEETGNSTIARQTAIEYFSLYTKENPIFSMGFVCPTNLYFSRIFAGPDETARFDDLGIMNMWYHYGIMGVIVAVILFSRLLYLFVKIYYINNSKNKVLIAGMLAYLLTSQISLGAFDGQRIFTLVCMWAMFEYEAYESTAAETKFSARSLIKRKNTPQKV